MCLALLPRVPRLADCGPAMESGKGGGPASPHLILNGRRQPDELIKITLGGNDGAVEEACDTHTC